MSTRWSLRWACGRGCRPEGVWDVEPVSGAAPLGTGHGRRIAHVDTLVPQLTPVIQCLQARYESLGFPVEGIGGKAVARPGSSLL